MATAIATLRSIRRPRVAEAIIVLSMLAVLATMSLPVITARPAGPAVSSSR